MLLPPCLKDKKFLLEKGQSGQARVPKVFHKINIFIEIANRGRY